MDIAGFHYALPGQQQVYMDLFGAFNQGSLSRGDAREVCELVSFLEGNLKGFKSTANGNGEWRMGRGCPH